MAQMFQNLHRTMRPYQLLKVQCACQHRAVFNRAQAAATFGPDATPMDIRDRATCSACGARGQARIWI